MMPWLTLPQPGTHQLVVLSAFSDNRFFAALHFRNGFCETLHGLCMGKYPGLQNFTVKTTDQVFIRLVGVFSGYLNHTCWILTEQMWICN